MYKLLPILLFAYGLAVTTDDIYDNSYALIIGIDKYKNVRSLDYAVKDANSISSLLQEKFNFPSHNIKTLLNEAATYSNIRNSLSEISSSAKANDRVLIFFAGHGMTDDLPDGGEMGYLLPIEAKRDELFTTSIPMDDLKRISSMSKSKHMLFLIDACYGGLAATGARGLSSTTPNYIDKITKDKSRQIITAGGRGEQVIEKSEWGHSAFTLNLIRALEDGKADLNDDGYITAEELGLFLKEKVTIDSGNQQTPVSRRFTSQEGEFVFIIDEVKIIINDEISNKRKDGESIDYDILADKLAEKLKTENDIEHKQSGLTKTYLNDKPLIINVGFFSPRSWTLLGFSKNIKTWGNNTLFASVGYGFPVIGIGLSNKTLNLSGIIGAAPAGSAAFYGSYSWQVHLGQHWLLYYGIGLGYWEDDASGKYEELLIPILGFDFAF